MKDDDKKPRQNVQVICGGIAGVTCDDEGQYCDFEEGNCTIADGQGICKDKPEVCTEDFTPVCGCDGKTHSNACQAAVAGVSIDHEGECKCETSAP